MLREAKGLGVGVRSQDPPRGGTVDKWQRGERAPAGGQRGRPVSRSREDNVKLAKRLQDGRVKSRAWEEQVGEAWVPAWSRPASNARR